VFQKVSRITHAAHHGGGFYAQQTAQLFYSTGDFVSHLGGI
jgi:hypothetical protein